MFFSINVNYKALMFMQIAKQRISEKLLWSLTNGTEYVNDECWKITGIHLKFAYLVKLASKQPLCNFDLWK